MSGADIVDLAVAVGKVALVLTVVGGMAFMAALIIDPPPERGAETPVADLTIERVNETHVRIVHAGGDAIPAENLLVTVDGRARPLGRVDPLTQGEAIAVQAPEGVLVEVYWAGEEISPKLLERERL